MSSVADKSLYRCDKYKLLDAFTDLILCDRFGLEQHRSGVQDEAAIALAKELLPLYDEAVATLPPFEDILGPLYMEIQSGWRGGRSLGEYYTPSEVSHLMAMMVVSEDDFSKYSISNPCCVADPCVGSGAMPLAFCRAVLQQHGQEALSKVALFGQDISHHGIRLFACQMLCNIQIHDLALAKVVATHGNSLTREAKTVVMQATHPDAIASDPEQVNPAHSDDLRALADANYSALIANGANLDELLVGRPRKSEGKLEERK